MKVIFEFPDDAWDGIQDSFAAAYGWQSGVVVNDVLVENPESKGDHATRKVMDYISDIWASYSITQALNNSKAMIMNIVNTRVDEVKQSTLVSIIPSGV